MTTETDGTQTAPAASPETGNQGAPQADTQTTDASVQAPNPFSDLQVAEDTREWIAKRGFKGIDDLAKTAHEQEKLLGNAIRVPAKGAPPEEVEAYLDKLGRPKTADGYELTPPESLPEGLPYDGDRAKQFKELAHKNGLTSAQAKALHDWAVSNAVNDYQSATGKTAEQRAEIAKAETEKLTRLWGPLDGDTAKINLTFADKALREVGGEDVLAEFKRAGLIGDEGNVILSAPIAVMMAKFGQALYKEDDVLKGRADRLHNPFADGASQNVTAQMKLYREDPEHALAMIAAAGKKPEDFGLRPK